MADVLDENYDIEEKFVVKQVDANDSTSEHEEANATTLDSGSGKKRKFDQVKSDKNKKNKKKNITEILKLKKDELSEPTYAINEFKRHLCKYIKTNLSSVERNELNLSEVSLDGEQVESIDEKLEKIILKRKKISNLPMEEQFNAKFGDKLEDLLAKSGSSSRQSPFIVIVASSAVRCIEIQKKLDLTNEMIRNKKVRWIHAFAKHKKLKEQVEFVKNTKTPIHLVYATPQRLSQLVEANALKIDSLKYIVIDYSFRDVKQKRFIDMPEMREEFIKFCFNSLLKLNKEKTQVKFCLT